MRIIDKQGNSHKITLGKTIYVDTHAVGTIRQTDSLAFMHDFSLPPQLQGLGIGSTLLHHIEILLRAKHVYSFFVVIPFDDCPIHSHFWKKHGYSQNKNVFTKEL